MTAPFAVVAAAVDGGQILIHSLLPSWKQKMYMWQTSSNKC